jgi:hemerythrin-like domain-containing protein
MTTITTERPNTHEMIVVHRVFRREIELMPRLIRAVPDGDTTRARVLVQAFSDYQLGLHHHHTGEDDLVWPLLLARVDLEAEIVLRMEAQHEVVGRTLDEAAQLMPAWAAAPSAVTAAPVIAALTEHRAALLEHLQDEEVHILPLIEEHLTVAEWARLGERFATETPKSKQMFFLGMILEDADQAERDAMLANLPAPIRLVWRTIGQRQFNRKVRKIRGGIDPHARSAPALPRRSAQG